MSRSFTSKMSFCPSELIRSRSCPERRICYKGIGNLKPLPLVRQYAGCFPNTTIPMLPQHYKFFNKTLPLEDEEKGGGCEDIETQCAKKELEITGGKGIFTIE